jgi:hypothetical protein
MRAEMKKPGRKSGLLLYVGIGRPGRGQPVNIYAQSLNVETSG